MSRKKTASSRAREKNKAPRLEPALEALRAGGVVVFPTETFYGLAADALNEAAVQRVANLKGRNLDQPIGLIVADGDMLKEVVREVPPRAERLIHRFWPGPLTLVLTANEGLPPLLCNAEGGVGVRVSSHPVAAALVRGLGSPITATSANPSGAQAAKTVEEARRYFTEEIKIFLDGGKLKGERGSTVLDMQHDRFHVIREGEISSVELEKVLFGPHGETL